MTAEATTASTTAAETASTATTKRTVLVLVLSALAAAAATTIVAFTARAVGADPEFPPLQPYVYLTFAIPGLLAAVGGWVLAVRYVRRSARALTVLVPVLLVLSFTPDVALLLLGFIPGANLTAVVALMFMHVIVAASAVIAGRTIAPPQ